MTAKTTAILDFYRQGGMRATGIVIEVAGKTTTAPVTAYIMPVLCLLLAQMTACTQFAQ